MRINSNTDKFAVQAQNRDDSKKPKAAEGGQEAGAASVVSLGDAARRMSAASTELEAAVQTRIDDVRAKLQAGEYPIDFTKLAERIVDDEATRLGIVK